MTTILENIKDSVEQGHYKVTEQLIKQALKKHVPALRIVEDSMVPAMRQMGEKYKMTRQISLRSFPAPDVCGRVWICSLLIWKQSVGSK